MKSTALCEEKHETYHEFKIDEAAFRVRLHVEAPPDGYAIVALLRSDVCRGVDSQELREHGGRRREGSGVQIPRVSCWRQNENVGTPEMRILSWVEHLVRAYGRMSGCSENKVSHC